MSKKVKIERIIADAEAGQIPVHEVRMLTTEIRRLQEVIKEKESEIQHKKELVKIIRAQRNKLLENAEIFDTSDDKKYLVHENEQLRKQIKRLKNQ